MQANRTFTKGAALAFALAVFAAPVMANELWVAPAKNSADQLSADNVNRYVDCGNHRPPAR